MSAFYKTTTSEYGQKWAVTENTQPLKSETPTWQDIGKNLTDFRKAEKVLKNQLVAAKWGKNDEEALDELGAAKKKLDQNAIVAKKFPVQPGEYKYPEPGLKVGSPLYMTTYMDIGRLLPSGYEITDRYFPLNNKFSNEFSGGMTRNQSLNTAVTNSKVHKAFDGTFGPI
jgi:hypothetical protein